LPVFCPSDFQDCWDLSAKAVKTALALRTPVVLLTSKEMVMTQQSFDISQLGELPALAWPEYEVNGAYQPYAAKANQPPPFLPVGNNLHQVRLNASTHGNAGLIQKNTPEALANTKRLRDKILQRVDEYTVYDYDRQDEADILLVTYDVSTGASRQAVQQLRAKGRKVSLLCVKTLLPVAPAILEIMNSYKTCIFVEENLTGLYAEMIYGQRQNPQVRKVNKIGHMITPAEIEKEVLACL
jgi:2-oxoglutarate ferredoxin oxidoreductase subunit alpha